MSISRRRFMQNVGLLSLSIPHVALSKTANKETPLHAQSPGFTTEPYLQSLTSSSVSIQVLTRTNSYTWVEFGEQKIDQSHFESRHGLKVANCRYFNFKLYNLKPDTLYQYRIHTKPIQKLAGYEVLYGEEMVSETYSFRTLPQQKESCNIILFNDIHDRNGSFKTLWQVRNQQTTDLVVFNGDMFNQIKDENQLVENFLLPINELFSTRTPFVFNRGNHETRGLFARELDKYFDYPNQKTYQAFQLGPIFWIFLDSGEDKFDSSKEYFGLADFDRLRLEQRDWLLEIVKTPAFKRAKFRAVAIHMPPLYSKDWHGPTHCHELFVPIFNKHKIDIVYSGHNHKAEFIAPNDDHKFALFIGGGPKEGQRTILDVQANSKSLHSQLISENGQVIKSWTIKA